MTLGWSVAELNERMSAYEMLRWEILEQIDPWGPRRGDYQAAVIAWAIANVLGGKTPFKKIMRMFDFEEKHEQSDKEIGQLFNQAAGKR